MIFSTFIPLFALPTVLSPLQLIFNMYVFFIDLYLTLHFYSSFPLFFSPYLLALFSLLYSPVGTLL